MVIDLSKLNMNENPMLLLKNQNGDVLSPIAAVLNFQGDLLYNEISQISFNVPLRYNGITNSYYDKITSMQLIEWKDIGCFILQNPSTTGDGIKETKKCTAYSLEYEFTFKKISLENATYNFWNPVTRDSSLLGIILSYMPSWNVGVIDSSLIGKYRTFEVNYENLYDFIKNTVQETYNCIFEFDTLNRLVNVRDANSNASYKPVYLSTDNLIKEIEIEEQSDNIITVLDVNGAEGVTIRSVNPLGTNKIYNLDYFMNTDNFSQSMIDKWNNWKSTFDANQQLYYNITLNHSIQISRYTTEKAVLTELQGELSTLEAQQAVIIQAIAQGLSEQSELSSINSQILSKQNEITTQKFLLEQIQTNIDNIKLELQEINQDTAFTSFFTENEMVLLDRYFKEDAITENSFVAPTVKSYTNSDNFKCADINNIIISGSEISTVEYASTKRFYSIRGGTIVINQLDYTMNANIIRATLESNTDGRIILSCYLDDGALNTIDFESGNLSITGNASQITSNNSSLIITEINANIYFTKNVTDYQQREIEWDLYDYGKQKLEKLSSIMFSFKISLENFFALDIYLAFLNQITLGEKVYVDTNRGRISPIVIGVSFNYDSKESIEVEFGSTFDIYNATYGLGDLNSNTTSMGKSVDFSKYNYNKFVDSGAESSVRDFINSALDVSKNAILSSSGQAVSWDKAGLRLRKWLDEEAETYEPEQIWMANNSIMFTQDNWANALIGIGKFVDANLGSCYGIVAPNIVGTLLAGENLVIESIAEDGSTRLFKVDGDGALLYNAYFDIISASGTQITLNPDKGIAIGTYPLYSLDNNNEEVINENNAKFWVDVNGDLHLSGTLEACDGVFSGELSAATGSFTGSLEVGGATAFRVDTNGNLKIGGTVSNPNFSVDNLGNLIANSGTFKGNVNAISMKINDQNVLTNTDIYGNATSNSKISNTYLDLGNIILNGTTGDITLSGNIYISGNIQWNSSNSPVLVKYSLYSYGTPLTYPSYWHDYFNSNDLYASYSYDGGNTWTNAVQIRGVNGRDGYDGQDGQDGSDAYVTAYNVFNALTSNGSLFGCFSDENNRLYINAEYINTDYLSIGGSFGYLSYGIGNNGVNNTRGIKMTDSNSYNYIIVTTSGCRMTSDTSFYVAGTSIIAESAIQEGSDQRLKNNISTDLSSYELFYMDLHPSFYKFNNGTSGRYHIGFIAQDVESALINNGLTTQDFAGITIEPVVNEEAAPQEDMKDNIYRLRYSEFISLNTYMIQKLYHRIEILEEELERIKNNEE